MSHAGTPQPEPHRFADDGTIPNSPLPALIYRAALVPLPADAAAAFERLFARHGWEGAWRDGIYPFHHFHSNAHEVLGIARGEVTVRLGGPGGAALTLRAGDVAVLPAGVGHKNEGSSPDLLVVGAYPGGGGWDLRRGAPEEREIVRRNIEAVTLPAADPVHGSEGPLQRLWATTG